MFDVLLYWIKKEVTIRDDIQTFDNFLMNSFNY